MKLPTTRRGCIDEYERRRETDAPLTKLDMYLGGMICCSNAEFLYRKPEGIDSNITGGDAPCLCVHENGTYCSNNCADATEETLKMPWNAPLYGGNKE